MTLRRRSLLATLGLFALQPDAFAQRSRTLSPTAQLIVRYAQGVPDAQQTRFDKAVARALDRIPGLKAQLRQRIKATALPPFEPDALTKARAPRRVSDSDLIDPKVFKRIDLPKAPTHFRLHVEGLHCFTETSEASASDKIYGIYALITPKSGPTGDRWKVVLGDFPLGSPEWLTMDAGDTVKGPRRLLYDGPLQDMVMISTVWEHDDGAPGGSSARLTAMVNARLAALQEVDPNATLDDVADNLAVEVKLLNDGENFYFPGSFQNDDDLIQAKVRAFKKSDLIQMVQREPYDTEATPDGKELPARMPYHFRSRHKGDGGAHYLCYYKVEKS